MAISEYLKGLRSKVGNDLIVCPSVSAAIFDERGRLLLVEHSSERVWGTPGGAMDPEETPADAVVREVWEETGLRVEPIRLVGIYAGPDFRVVYENGDVVTYVITVFECRVTGGELRPDQDETLSCRYVAPEEMSGMHLTRWGRIVVPDILARRGGCFTPSAWKAPS